MEYTLEVTAYLQYGGMNSTHWGMSGHSDTAAAVTTTITFSFRVSIYLAYISGVNPGHTGFLTCDSLDTAATGF